MAPTTHQICTEFEVLVKFSIQNSTSKWNISLPSERILADYTHWTSPHAGIQLEFIEEFLVVLESDCPHGQHHYTLSMDEMKIKSGLMFNKHAGSLTGFADLGSANHNLVQAVSGEENATLAEQAFVFMARAVFKPSLTMPAAHYSVPISKVSIYIITISLIRVFFLCNTGEKNLSLSSGRS